MPPAGVPYASIFASSLFGRVTPMPDGLGRSIVRNSLFAAAGRLVAIVAWLLLTPAILARLGQTGFAVWAIFFAFTGYFAALDFGLVQGVLRHVAAARVRNDHASAGGHASLGMLGFMVLGVLWCVLAFLFRAPVMGMLRMEEVGVPGAQAVLPLATVVFAAAGCANVGIVTLQACGRFDLANRASLVVTIVQSVGCLAVLHGQHGLVGLMLSVGVGWLGGVFASVMFLRAHVPDFRWGGTSAVRSCWRGALGFGVPLQWAGVCSSLHAQLDKFMLPSMVGLGAVTSYELGARIPGALQTFPQMLLLALTPVAASLHASGDDAGLHALHARGQRYLLASIVVIAAALLGPAPRWIMAWVGPGQEDAVFVLRGLTVATAFWLASGAATVVVRSLGRTNVEAAYATLSLGLHLLLGIWWMPRYGLSGGVAATVCANAIALPFYLAWTARAAKWRFRDIALKPHVRPVIALATGTLVSEVLGHRLPLLSGFGGWGLLLAHGGLAVLVTTLMLIATRHLDWREIRGVMSRRF